MMRSFQPFLIHGITVVLVLACFCVGCENALVREESSVGSDTMIGNAAQVVSHSETLSMVLIALMVILIASRFGGVLFERIGQPSVLGELVAGIVMGNLVLLNPSWTFFEPLRLEPMSSSWAIVIEVLGQIGIILLLFEVGLETTMREMRRVGTVSTFVAMVGVVAPFILGFFASWLFISEVPRAILDRSPSFDLFNIHIYIGAILSATSVGITARVFKDLGKTDTSEARIVLGAAVIDDVFGLIILSIVSGLVVAQMTGIPLGILSLGKIAAMAVAFLLLAVGFGMVAGNRLIRMLGKTRTPGMTLVSALLFCFLYSYMASAAGLAAIVGAFAAGLVLDPHQFDKIGERRGLKELLEPLLAFFVPIFFVLMGIRVRLETFVHPEVMGIAVALIIAAVLGKQVCGLAVPRQLDRLSIGFGMIPRGEVGLIFASIGKGLGVIDDSIFSAVVIMVIVTTLVTPPLLKYSLGRWEASHG